MLVHGAWADASSWNSVIPELQQRGFTVYAPPNPLRGLSGFPSSDPAYLHDFLTQNAALAAALDPFKPGTPVMWVQEEPANMGAWHFVFHRTHPIEQRGYQVTCVSRVESGSPATGSHKIHEQELDELLEETFSGL